jgi:replicative DNA helicase
MTSQFDKEQREQLAKETDFLRQDYLLPYDLDTEKDALGLTMLDEKWRLAMISALRPEDFYCAPYRHTFEAISFLETQGLEVTPITIGGILRGRGFLEKMGGITGISNLTEYSGRYGSRKLVDEYAQKLRDLTVKRNAFVLAKTLALSAFDQTKTASQVLDLADEEMSKLRAKKETRRTVQTYAEIAVEARIELEQYRAGTARGIRTGIPELDRRLRMRGLARKELYYFGAMSSMGKTALLLQILDYINMQGLRSLFFSIEMSKILLLFRTIQRITSGFEISPYTIREIKEPRNEREEKRKRYGDYVYRRALEVLVTISEWKGLVDDETRSWQDIKAKIREEHRAHPLDVIGGDYIQLAEIKLESNQSRRDLEVGKISTDSKALAKELDVPFIWLSQLRRMKDRAHRPEMDDFRETGQIENDADFMGIIYGDGPGSDNKANVKLYCPKQRNGMAGWEIEMDFDKKRQFFNTEELQRLIDNSNPTDDEIFLREFLSERDDAPQLHTIAPPPTKGEILF